MEGKSMLSVLEYIKIRALLQPELLLFKTLTPKGRDLHSAMRILRTRYLLLFVFFLIDSSVPGRER